MATIDNLDIQISVSMNNATKSIESLTSKLNLLKNNLSKVGVSTSGIKNISSSFKNVVPYINKINSSVKNLVPSFMRFRMAIRIADKAIDAFADSTKESINYIENLNYFVKAFEGIAQNADYSNFQNYGYNSADAYANSFIERAKELTAKMTGFDVGESGLLKMTGAASLGINPSEVVTNQAIFAQMASSMGTTSEQALKLSNVMIMLGGDLASLRNMDFSDVWKDLQSGMVGMSRSVDKYGSNIRLANLQTKLNEIGIEANIQALNQNEKALLRTIIMLESSKFAWKDLADTLNQPANQIRILSSNFKNLGRMIGDMFLPVISATLPYINGFVIALQKLVSWFTELIGVDLEGITTSIGNIDLSEILGTDEGAEGVEDITTAVKKLKTATLGIDELNINAPQESSLPVVGLGGIDSAKLDAAFNKIADEYTAAWEKAFNEVENKAQNISNVIFKAFSPIIRIIENFSLGNFFEAGNDVSNLIASINEFFANAIDKVDWYGIGTSIGEFLSGIDWSRIFESVGKLISSVFTGIFELVSGAFDTAPIETTIIGIVAASPILAKGFGIILNVASLLSGGLSTLSGVLYGLSPTVLGVTAVVAGLATGLGVAFATNEDVRNSFLEAAAAIGDNFAPILTNITDTVLPDLTNGWNALIAALTPFTDFLSTTFVSIWQDMINPALLYAGETILPTLSETFTNLWNGVLVPFGEFLGSVLFPAFEKISSVMSKLWNNIVLPLANGIGNILSKAFEGIAAVLNNTVIPLVNLLISGFSFLWNNVLSPVVDFLWDVFQPAFDGVFGAISGVIDGVTDTFGGLIDFVTGVFSLDWEKAWDGIVETFTGLFEGIVNIIKAPINGIIGLINGLIGGVESMLNYIIDGLNLINITIPEWVPVIGGASFGFDFDHVEFGRIPTFQTGGFPEDGLFFANHTELVGQFSNGRTAVANNEQIIAGITSGVAQANEEEVYLLREQNELLRQILSKDLSVNIGDRDIARANARGSKSLGYALIN